MKTLPSNRIEETSDSALKPILYLLFLLVIVSSFCVSLHVYAKSGGLPILEDHEIEFGRVKYGSQKYETVEIRNAGNMPLLINEIKVTGKNFHISKDLCTNHPVPSTASCKIVIVFKSESLLREKGYLEIFYNNSTDVMRMDLFAEGKKDKCITYKNFHIVEEGDTLSQISLLYCKDIDEIKKLNKIEDIDEITIGQRLKINLIPTKFLEKLSKINTYPDELDGEAGRKLRKLLENYDDLRVKQKELEEDKKTYATKNENSKGNVKNYESEITQLENNISIKKSISRNHEEEEKSKKQVQINELTKIKNEHSKAEEARMTASLYAHIEADGEYFYSDSGTAESFSDNVIINDVSTQATASLKIPNPLSPIKKCWDKTLKVCIEDELTSARDKTYKCLKKGINCPADEVSNAWEKVPERYKNFRDSYENMSPEFIEEISKAINDLPDGITEYIRYSEKLEKFPAVRKELFDIDVLDELSVNKIKDAVSGFEDLLNKIGTRIEKELLELCKSVTTLINDIGNLDKKIEGLSDDVKTLETKIKNKTEQLNIEEKVRNNTRIITKGIEHKIKKIEKETKNVATQFKETIEFLGNKELILFSTVSSLEFSFNFYTGSHVISMETPIPGISINNDDIQSFITKGELRWPKIDLLEIAAQTTGTKLKIDDTEYWDKREERINNINRHMQDNQLKNNNVDITYYPQKIFVDFFSTKNAIEGVAEAVLTGGNSAKNFFEELKNVLSHEIDSVSTWLLLSGQKKSKEIIADIIYAGMINDNSITLPKVDFDSDTVRYHYNVEAIGASFIPEGILKEIIKEYEGVIQKVSDNFIDDHFSYSLSIQDELTNYSLDDYLSERLNNFGKSILEGNRNSDQLFVEVIEELIKRFTGKKPKISKVLKLVQNNAGFQETNALITTKLQKLTGITYTELFKNYIEGHPLIDLRETKISTGVSEFFKDFSLGNKGKLTVEKLEFNINNVTLEGKIELHHKHSWGSLEEILSR